MVIPFAPGYREHFRAVIRKIKNISLPDMVHDAE